MEVSAHTVANAFLALASAEGKDLTNMQLQKLVFLAQGYSMAILHAPIYYHNTHAWQFGPVIPKLYKQLQKYGSGVVNGRLDLPEGDSGDLDESQLQIIRTVWNAYKKYSGPQLSEITHRPGTPWSKTWATSQFGVIPVSEIGAYYAGLIAANR